MYDNTVDNICHNALVAIQEPGSKCELVVDVFLECVYNHYEFSSGMARGAGCYIPFSEMILVKNTLKELTRIIADKK